MKKDNWVLAEVVAYVSINLQDLESCGLLEELGMVEKYTRVLESRSPRGNKLVGEFMKSARGLREVVEGLDGKRKGG